jgi:hypothetical protein
MKTPPLPLLLVLLLASPCVANIAITTTSLPAGTLNKAYSAAINASGGCPPYAWTITSGSLPAGITKKVSSTTTSLNLSGTPTTAATSSFTVSAKGCGGLISTVSYKLVIQSSGGITIGTTKLPNGTVNTAYSAAIQVSGGCTPYSWAISSGSLPPGVTAKTSSTTTSLNLSGTPTKALSDAFTVSATGCGGGIAKASYTVVIQSGAIHVVNLQWKPSTSTNVAGYNVYRSPDGVSWKKQNVSLIASTLYSDSSVSNSSTYYYAASAVNINGSESSKSSSIKVSVP